MVKMVLQFGMLVIPSVIALCIWNRRKFITHCVRAKRFAICFFGINASVFLTAYVRGVKGFSLNNMTYSYCIKWLAAGIILAASYTRVLPFAWKCFLKMGRLQKMIIVLLTQGVVVATGILLLCCKEYPSVDVIGQMHPGEYTYMDDEEMWRIDQTSGYKPKDIILSGPYISLEKGSYTVTVEYDSCKTQFFQINSEQYSDNLEVENAVFLGGGQRRKANIRVNGEVNDLDVQIRYSGQGDIRIAHIWIQRNNAVHMEYVLILAVLFLIWDLWKYLYEIRTIRHPTRETVKTACSAFLSTLAVSFSGRVMQDGTFFSLLRYESNGMSIVFLIVGIAVFVFYRRYPIRGKECRIEIKGLAALFTICMTIGTSISANGSLKFILNSLLQFGVCVLCAFGYYILFRNGIHWLFSKMDSLSEGRKIIALEQNITVKQFSMAFGILSTFWLPILICFWPGSIWWDGMVQINMALGMDTLTNHHPWLSTMFMKCLLNMGISISDNMGVFALVLGSEIIELTIYAYTCCTIRKIFGQASFTISILFYSLHPIFAMFGQAVMKDGVYAAIFTLYLTEYTKCVWEERQNKGVSVRRFVILAVIGSVACIFRKNGIYVVFPSYVGLICIGKNHAKRMLITALSIFIAGSFWMTDRVLPTRLEIVQGSTRELLSIPFQQTARCFRDYEEDITSEEFETINRVLDAERLKDLYTPETSDPVKGTYKKDTTSEELQGYFKVWGKMFLKYPITYIEATLQGSYGYWYPFRNFRGKQTGYISINYNAMTGGFDPHYLFSYEVRNKIGEYIYMHGNIFQFYLCL